MNTPATPITSNPKRRPDGRPRYTLRVPPPLGARISALRAQAGLGSALPSEAAFVAELLARGCAAVELECGVAREAA